LAEGNITGLFLAGRLTELPLGVFAIAIATVVLPVMSRQAAHGNNDEMLLTLNFALRQVALITIPASVGLLILREEIVSVLFQYGEFTAESTSMTAAALAGYSVGLIAFAGIRIVAPGFYAMRDTRTPVKIAAVAMVVNVLGCLVLIPWFGHAGIAVANSLAAYLNLGVLLVLLRGRVGSFGGGSLLASYARLAAASAVMGWVVWGLRSSLMGDTGAAVITRVLALGAIIGIGILTYLAAVVLMRAPELTELRQMRAQGG
jgi:putative peptidoglycan lipid II flippase